MESVWMLKSLVIECLEKKLQLPQKKEININKAPQLKIEETIHTHICHRPAEQFNKRDAWHALAVTFKLFCSAANTSYYPSIKSYIQFPRIICLLAYRLDRFTLLKCKRREKKNSNPTVVAPDRWHELLLLRSLHRCLTACIPCTNLQAVSG